MADKAQIQEAIKVQGEVVRKLKAEKASKEQVCVYNIYLYSCFYSKPDTKMIYVT